MLSGPVIHQVVKSLFDTQETESERTQREIEHQRLIDTQLARNYAKNAERKMLDYGESIDNVTEHLKEILTIQRQVTEGNKTNGRTAELSAAEKEGEFSTISNRQSDLLNSSEKFSKISEDVKRTGANFGDFDSAKRAIAEAQGGLFFAKEDLERALEALSGASLSHLSEDAKKEIQSALYRIKLVQGEFRRMENLQAEIKQEEKEETAYIAA